MSRYLAIDLDSHGLYVASGSASRGKTTIEKVAYAPIEGPPLSPGTAVALGRQLKDLLKQAGLAPAPVLLSLGRDKIILKDVVHPPTSGPEEPIVVRFQAVKDLTNDPDEMELDYLPTGQTMDGQKTALAVFARKDAVNAAKAFCESAGLKLAGLTPRPFAAVAAVQAAVAAGTTEPTDDPTDPIAVLTLTDSGGEFTAAKAGRVLFSRAIPAQAVQSETALVSEVRRNLAVFAGMGMGEPARAVYVAEAGPPDAGWTFRLAAGLPTPVHRFDPLSGTSFGGELPAQSQGRFAGAAGLLALAAASSELPINFISPRQPKAEPNKNRTRLVIAALAAGLLLAGGGVLSYMYLEDKDKEIADLTQQSKNLDIAIKSSEEDQNRLFAAEEFIHHGIPVHDELYEASVKFPNIDRMKLKEFEFDSKKLPNEKERERLAKELAAKPLSATQKKQAELNPAPTGTIKLTLVSAESNQVENLVSAYVKDGKSNATLGYYRDTKPSQTGGAQGAAAGGRAQFIITTNVTPRKASDYRHKLTVTAPVAAKPVPEVVDPDVGGPIGELPVNNADPDQESN